MDRAVREGYSEQVIEFSSHALREAAESCMLGTRLEGLGPLPYL